MKKILGLFLFILFYGCKTEKKDEANYNFARHVGDIEHDHKLDNPNFKPCFGDSNVFQYFNNTVHYPFVGEKDSIKSIFHSQYQPIHEQGQTGLIRIRFMVNCQGIPGRFRMIMADKNYKPFEFDQRITNQLLKITKSLKGWTTISDNNNNARDYYMYLSFKLDNGDLKAILP